MNIFRCSVVEPLPWGFNIVAFNVSTRRSSCPQLKKPQNKVLQQRFVTAERKYYAQLILHKCGYHSIVYVCVYSSHSLKCEPTDSCGGNCSLRTGVRPAAVPPAAAVLNKGCTGSQTRYCTTSTPWASMRTVFPADNWKLCRF